MAPSTLDLLLLTFNCAKNLANVGVFAGHLKDAFGGGGAAGLPDVVVFSLQEVAPLSYSFIGGYFLNPYVARFHDALNLAAVEHVEDDTTARSSTRPKKPYSLVKTGNVGYTAIILFAREPEKVTRVQEAEVGFGAAEMGNKGAVGLRIEYGDAEFTFVATHLAAMEWNLPRRNANWGAIMRGLTFENPEEVMSKHGKEAGKGTLSEGENNDERTRLLHDEHDEHHQRLQRQLHDLSIFKSNSHLFVAGDLNYRISTVSPRPGAPFPSVDPDSPDHYSHFLPLDQLTRERKAGRTLHGLTEAPVSFPPTYKYDIKPGSDDQDPKWEFAPHRYPSWTDRILYLPSPGVEVLAYDAMPIVRSSDHRPVYLRIKAPLSPAKDVEADDPRRRLPVEIDPEAWERRRAARRKEVMVGWSMFVWSTWEGAVILGLVAAIGIGAYWLSHSGVS